MRINACWCIAAPGSSASGFATTAQLQSATAAGSADDISTGGRNEEDYVEAEEEGEGDFEDAEGEPEVEEGEAEANEGDGESEEVAAELEASEEASAEAVAGLWR